MKNFSLIYDPEIEKDKLDEILGEFEFPPKVISFSDHPQSKFQADEWLIFYLSDLQLKEFIALHSEEELQIALLLHPNLKQGKEAFDISGNLQDAIKAIAEVEKVPRVDFMEVNGQLILNTFILGESLSIFYGDRSVSFFTGIKLRFQRFIKLFKNVKLVKITLKIDEEEETGESLDTAAQGILAAVNCQKNLIFRRLIEDTGMNDGLIHTVILAPTSLISLLRFGLQNLFSPFRSKSFPHFIGYISSKRISISSENQIPFAFDDMEEKSEKITLSVKETQLRILTGKKLRDKKSGSGEIVRKTKALPRADLRDELTRGFLPWVRHATSDEFKDLFTLIRQNSRTTGTYLVLMVLSTVIATFGIFGDSAPVVIGAMILAPLMGPTISLAMGILRQDEKLIKNSSMTIFWGIVFSLFFSVLITWVTPLQVLNDQMLARIRPNLLDLGIAVASGIAGAYAYSKEEIAKTLAGVAISVALVPPLAVAGIGLGWEEWNVFGGAILLLGTNLAGIVLAAAVTFLLLGFSPFRIAKKGIVISLIILLAISTPLGLSFKRMVNENRIIQELSGAKIGHGLLRNIKVVSLSPLRLSVTILSEEELGNQDFEEIKKEIEDKIGEESELELTLGIQLGEPKSIIPKK